MKSKIYNSIFFFLVILMTAFACSDQYEIKESNKETSQKNVTLRMGVIKGSSFFNVKIFAYKIQNNDTLFFKSFLFEGAALLNPIELSLEMDKYTLVAVGNVDVSAFQPSLNDPISKLLYTLTAHVSGDGTFNPLHELYYGKINTIIGVVASHTINLKHAVAKVRINYQHSDPLTTNISWKLSNLYNGLKFNGVYINDAGASVKVQKTYLPPILVPPVYKDSIYVFPSENPTTFYLTHKRMVNSVEVLKEYQSALSNLILPNYITDINVYGGQDASVNITQTQINDVNEYYILDEAPSSAVNIILGGFLPSEQDTINMQALDFVIDVNEGVLENYLTNFKFTITKTAPLPLPTPSVIEKTVALKIQDGKLKTIKPISLSRGTYTLSAYSLSDVEGSLKDPAGKAVTKTFTVGLDYQVINLALDGRQGEDNVLLRQAITGLHGSSQVPGSVYPGTVKFALDPLGSSFPKASDGVSQTNWYVDNNAYVEKIPIRGEWRAYNLVYRGINKTSLAGTLTSPLTSFNQLIFIDLRSNKLTGGLDSHWRNIAQLNTLILNNNLLSGNINNLEPLANIERISLEFNDFSGAITPGLNGCVNSLRYLSINNNKFTGDLAVISTGISFLFIQRNRFTGGVGGKLKYFTISNASAQWDVRYNYFQCRDPLYTSTTRINPQYIPNTTTTTNTTICN